MADRILNLGSKKGFIKLVSVRNEEGLGISVSYWKSLESIQNGRANAVHRKVQAKGRETWYKDYEIQMAKVEYEYRK